MVRVFANGPGDMGLIPDQVIPKPCLTLYNIKYGSRVKWRNPGKGVSSSSTPWCSSYQKGSFRITFDDSYIAILEIIKVCANK